ncbi:MAG: ribonuclease P protein component [Chloroflexota bacterium]|nr:ribonuclease P protein component [Chloroflexota bacterium]
MRRELRLRRREDFARLRQEGRTIRHSWLMLSVATNEHGQNRYGFITTKQLGNAVVRNRVRRRLRAVMVQQHAQLKQGFDLVLIARPGIIDQPFAALQQMIADLARRAGLERESVP